MRFAEIGHTRGEVRPHGTIAAQHLMQCRLGELGPNTRERGRSAAFIAEIFAQAEEEFIALSIRLAKGLSVMAGGAVEQTQLAVGFGKQCRRSGLGLQGGGDGGALGGVQVKVRHAGGGLGSETAALGVHLGQRLGQGRLHIELGRLMAVGAAKGLVELGTFPLELEGSGSTAQAVEIEWLEASAQVGGEMGRFLFAHWHARHATGGAAVEGIAQKFDEVGVRVLGAEFAEGNVAAVVLRIRSVAMGAAKGAVQFLALDRVANHGSFRPIAGRQRHEIMPQGLNDFGFFLRI